MFFFETRCTSLFTKVVEQKFDLFFKSNFRWPLQILRITREIAWIFILITWTVKRLLLDKKFSVSIGGGTEHIEVKLLITLWPIQFDQASPIQSLKLFQGLSGLERPSESANHSRKYYCTIKNTRWWRLK